MDKKHFDETIIQLLEFTCSKIGRMTAMVVRIAYKYTWEHEYSHENVLYSLDMSDSWIPDYDWWEGQQDIIICGIIPLDMLIINGINVDEVKIGLDFTKFFKDINNGDNFCGNCKYCSGQTVNGCFICTRKFMKFVDPDDASCKDFCTSYADNYNDFKDNYNDFKDFCTSDAEICKCCKNKDTEVCLRCSHFPF